MRDALTQNLEEALNRIVNLLPDVLAALFLIFLGIFVAWLVKRAVIRIGLFLKLHRLSPRLFSKGDVRHTFLHVVGNIMGFIVFLVFFDNALLILRLFVLEEMVKSLALFIPKLIVASLIFGVGLLASNRVSVEVERVLASEGFTHAYALSRFVKVFLLVFVVALALLRLDISREIVLYGFLITYGSFGLGLILALGFGSQKAVQKLWEKLLEKEEE